MARAMRVVAPTQPGNIGHLPYLEAKEYFPESYATFGGPGIENKRKDTGGSGKA